MLPEKKIPNPSCHSPPSSFSNLTRTLIFSGGLYIFNYEIDYPTFLVLLYVLLYVLDELSNVDGFTFGENTGVQYSCSAVISGMMMVFGGSNGYPYKNQISVVESCQLRRIGQLPIDFESGACNTFLSNDQKDEILLCFANNSPYTRCDR